MSKRGHAASDDERSSTPGREGTSSSSPANHKRARLGGLLNAGASTSTSVPALTRQDESDDDSESEMDQDSEEDEQLKAQLMQTLTGAPAAGNNTTSSQAGYIETLELTNFMNHKLMKLNFGPQINFIVGNNGSGKSASLSGITMALGGNSRATDRGDAARSLVNDKADTATARVTLANRGADAYHPEIYGPTIVVERSIKRTGASTYKVKSHAGRTIESRKAAIEAILDHFNIQIDNPLTVLTQGTAKTFLANAGPADKYQFFLQGTQLARLTELYEHIRSNIGAISQERDRKSEVLPELKKAYERAKTALNEAKRMLRIEDDIEKLQDQWVWALVFETEAAVKLAEQEVERREEALIRVKGKIKELKDVQKELDDRVTDLQSARADTQQEDVDLGEQIAELSAEIDKAKERLKTLKREQGTIQAQIDRDQLQIATFINMIEIEKAKEQAAGRLDRHALADEETALDKRYHEVATQVAQAEVDLNEAGSSILAAEDALREAKEVARRVQGDVNDVVMRASQAQSNQGNSLMRYPRGKDVIEVVKDIGSYGMSWRFQPLGPLGEYVKIKDAKYSGVVDKLLENFLQGFIVQDEADKARLVGIFRRHRVFFPVYTVTLDDRFDCSRGEPAEGVPTVLRVLQFSEPIVMQAAVTLSRIEQILLAPTRQDADALALRDLNNCLAVYSADGYRNSLTSQKTIQSNALEALKFRILNADVQAYIQHLRGEEARLREELEEAKSVVRDREQAHKDSKSGDSQVRGVLHQLRRELGNIARHRQDIQNQLDTAEPSDLSATLENKRACEEHLRELKNQMEDAKAAEEDRNGSTVLVYQELKELKQRQQQRNRVVSSIMAQIDKVVEEQTHNNVALMHWATKVDKSNDEVARAEEQLSQFQQKLETELNKAREICERPASTQKAADAINREIKKLEKILATRKREQQGRDARDLAEEYEERQRVLSDAKDKLGRLNKTIAGLNKALEHRMIRWDHFRTHCAMRARTNFAAYMAKRGFDGAVIFDHGKLKIDIKVSTEPAAQHGDAGGGDDASGSGKKTKKKKSSKDQQKRLKDVKLLSGGEKSYSTVCFLLTIWDVIGSPVRCLDEYDVFMDSQVRALSTQMMVDVARSEKKQFIFISPQAMTHIKFDDEKEVKIVRMTDPRSSS